MFILPRLCTEDNVLIGFQYKIIDRILLTNNLLFKMGKNNTNKCSFCQMYIEDILHVFDDCLIVKNLWCVVEICWRNYHDTFRHFTHKDITVFIILGYKLHEKPLSDRITNNIILHIKFYIWMCKVLE